MIPATQNPRTKEFKVDYALMASCFDHNGSPQHYQQSMGGEYSTGKCEVTWLDVRNECLQALTTVLRLNPSDQLITNDEGQLHSIKRHNGDVITSYEMLEALRK